MTSDITWGPEIRVDGKRPEWLADGDRVRWYSAEMSDAWWCNPNAGMGTEPTARGLAWDHEITAIRLPADHPHYATQTPATAPSGGEVGPEVVERMIALVRAVTGETSFAAWLEHTTEARAIVALLPEPVDGDLLEAREIAAARCSDPLDRIRFVNGDNDTGVAIPAILAAIKRGRALERGEG